MDSITRQLIALALEEDIGPGDVTSAYFIPEGSPSVAHVKVKAEGVLAGTAVAKAVCAQVDPSIEVQVLKEDGARVSPGDLVMKWQGPTRTLLTAERTALNFLQRLSGVATQTARYVALTQETHCTVLDTRKTTPGWRSLEKAAVLAGGGQNHRMGLYDRAMVKDNHLAAQGDLTGLQTAITRLKEQKPSVGVELEADTLAQMRSFFTLSGVDYLLLDNMSLDQLREAVAYRNEHYPSGPLLEASGGITLETVRAVAQTGVHSLSVGALTHSAVALDISLDFQTSP